MNSQEIKKAAKEMIVEYQKVLSLNISDEKRNEVKKMLREARKAKKNPELVYGSINRVVNLNLDMDNFLFQFKFKDPKGLKTKKSKTTKTKKVGFQWGPQEQKGFSLLFKNAQGGKTGHAITYMKENKNYFCIYITSNSTQLLEQTTVRINDKLDSKTFRFDGQSELSEQFNENIFSVIPEKPESLRGKVCCLIKNVCNLKRLSVLLYMIDKHNQENPTNQVHCKIIADEVDKTMSMTTSVIDDGLMVQRIIDESYEGEFNVRDHEEFPDGENCWVNYIFNTGMHECLIEILGLTATTSKLFQNPGINEVFGEQDELSFNTMVKEISKMYRNVKDWKTIEIEDKLGLEKSLKEILKKIEKKYNDSWYVFLPAKQHNKTHMMVVDSKLKYMFKKGKHDKTMVITSNQYGIVGYMIDENGDRYSVSPSTDSKVVSHKIASLVSDHDIRYLGITGLASLGRGITIQSSKEELEQVGIDCRTPLLSKGLVMTCIGVHNEMSVNTKLGHNSILVQRLSRGCTYIKNQFEPYLIAPKRIIELFTKECEFEETRMDEGIKI